LFYVVLFLLRPLFIFLFFLTRLSISWGCISTSFMPYGFGPYLVRIMEHCSCRGRKSNFSSFSVDVEADFSGSNINLSSYYICFILVWSFG
jgi:hypothetical protein